MCQSEEVVGPVNPQSVCTIILPAIVSKVHRGHLCSGGQRPSQQGQRLHQPAGGGRGGGGEAVQAGRGEQSQVSQYFHVAVFPLDMYTLSIWLLR